MTLPLVSVAVPVMNSARYLERTLDALLAQTYPNIEIVVLDNGSTDGSNGIAGRYAYRDHRVKINKLEHTVSQNESWRYVLRLAKGEYVNLHRASDVTLDPHFIERMAAPLLLNPDAAFSVCALRTVPEEGFNVDAAALAERCHAGIARFTKHVLGLTDRVALCRALIEHSMENVVGTPYAALVSRAALPMVHWSRTEVYWPESYADWDFMIRLFLHGRGVWVDDTQVDYWLYRNGGYWKTIGVKDPRTVLFDRLFRFMMPITVLTDPELYELRKEVSAEGMAELFQCAQTRLVEAIAASDKLVSPVSSLPITFTEAQS